MHDLLTGDAAAAWGARLAEADYVPAFPVTPQTEIIELLSHWIARGDLAARLVTLDSVPSMLTAAGGAAATGARVFTASPSQGLLRGLDVLYTVASWRAPFVLVNVSQALAAPITLGPDHSDILAARDTGFLQIHTETCQEVLDSVLMAYRLAEHPDVRLPALVNLDGFYLSSTCEPVELPAVEAVREFLPPYDPGGAPFAASQAVAQGASVLGGSAYTFFKGQMQRATEAALCAHDAIGGDFCDAFGRCYGAVEAYRLDDAERVIVICDSFSRVGKAEVARLRSRGERIGLLRLRLIRPFPRAEIAWLLGGRRAVAVIDQNISLGKGGILFAEVASAFTEAAPPLLSFVSGLGGRRFRPGEFDRIVAALHKAEQEGGAAEPQLLFTDSEYKQLREIMRVAQGNGAGSHAPARRDRPPAD